MDVPVDENPVPSPEGEEGRLRALEELDILDTSEEQVYDDMTMLASRICETPIALIALLDRNRQWFKSRVGMAATQTPREYAFCSHAIMRPDEVMIVNDALLDPRFASNPLVTGEPRIRFYAGAPLVTFKGKALGTICVIDHVPRELQQNQIEALRALSRQVVMQLELRRMLAERAAQASEMNAYQRQLEGYQRRIEKANAELEIQSGTDALTGLMNRRAFDARMEQESYQMGRHGHPMSLLMIDVDQFKSYNDTFGHVAGDEALRYIAEILRRMARKYDYVARFGGEEFAVISPRTGVEESLAIAERLRRAIEIAKCPNRPVTISIGADTSAALVDIAGIISRADEALYYAKEHGRNRVVHARKIFRDEPSGHSAQLI